MDKRHRLCVDFESPATVGGVGSNGYFPVLACESPRRELPDVRLRGDELKSGFSDIESGFRIDLVNLGQGAGDLGLELADELVIGPELTVE